MYIFSVQGRDVSAGATGATAVAPKFSDTLTLSQPGGGGQILPTIAEFEPKFSPWLSPCRVLSALKICLKLSWEHFQFHFFFSISFWGQNRLIHTHSIVCQGRKVRASFLDNLGCMALFYPLPLHFKFSNQKSRWTPNSSCMWAEFWL